MIGPVVYLISSTVVFLLLVLLYILEDRRGDRLLLSSLRSRLDRGLLYIKRQIIIRSGVTLQQIVKFLLHHGIQTVLRKMLRFVRSIEERLEVLLRKHRHANKKARREKTSRNHLDEIADHREKSALTEEQKLELRSR